jgi:hypothetical protein
MRWFMVVLWVALTGAQGAQAQNADIEATIRSQIDAFQVDDFERAFSYASPTLRSVFRTPENFGQMVTQGYPMVWRPARVQFLELREIEGDLWQKVLVTDAAGRVHILDYRMQNVDSDWKINGVQILDAPDATA